MGDINLLEKYFPGLSDTQLVQYKKLQSLYEFWNNQINVISRKDMDMFYEHHVLHSLSVAKFIQFKPTTLVLDIGTGGGFPGIPLAIMFPEATFLLVDSIGKKIKVVNEVVQAINLKNVKTQQARAEEIAGKFDFVVTRAVAAYPVLLTWIKSKIKSEGFNSIKNGIIALKGGELDEELEGVKNKIIVKNISDYFAEPFFETKKIVYSPL